MTKGKLFKEIGFSGDLDCDSIPLDKIIEARKEFPLSFTVYLGQALPQPKLVFFDDKEVKAWFEKWFGDEK